MANQIHLSEDQLEKLRSITGDGKSDFVEGYKYINSIVQNNQKVDAPTKFFFRGAQEVNADDPRSEANTFIRAVTKAGLAWDRRSRDLQQTSNMIAGNVVRQILDDRGIPALATILTEDVNLAIDKGLQSIGGWGAAFYFWNTPIDPDGTTVGQKIMANTEQREKFIAINTKALIETAAKHGLNPAQLLQRLDTAYKAQAPLNLKSDIATRAYEVIVEGQSLTGDPDRIDGHRAIRGYPTGEIKGWRGEGDDIITDQREIDKLSERSQHRTDWGPDHEWQKPSFEKRLQMNDDATMSLISMDELTGLPVPAAP